MKRIVPSIALSALAVVALAACGSATSTTKTVATRTQTQPTQTQPTPPTIQANPESAPYSAHAFVAVTRVEEAMPTLGQGNYHPYMDAVTQLANATDNHPETSAKLGEIDGRLILVTAMLDANQDPGQDALHRVSTDALTVGQICRKVLDNHV
jgi:hypothetical protein